MDTCYDLPIMYLRMKLESCKRVQSMGGDQTVQKDLDDNVHDVEGAIRHLQIIKAGGMRNIITLIHNMVRIVTKPMDAKEIAESALADVNKLAQMMDKHAEQRDQQAMVSAIGDMAICLITLAEWAQTPFESCMLEAYDNILSNSTTPV